MNLENDFIETAEGCCGEGEGYGYGEGEGEGWGGGGGGCEESDECAEDDEDAPMNLRIDRDQAFEDDIDYMEERNRQKRGK